MRLRAADRRPAPARAGFTLLEILLATLIAALLLAALYAAMHATLQQTQVTRDAVEVEDLSRGVFNKFTLDLGGTLAPLPPRSGGNVDPTVSTPSAPAASAAPAGTATGAASPTATTTPTAAAADPNAAAAAGATDTTTAASADYSFQGGLIGEDKKVVIYAARVPEAFGRYANPTDQVRPDQRQIIYWLEPGRGLYRRECPWVTADGVRNSIEADPDAADARLLAEEVTDLLLEYCDGTTWTNTWDGTTPGPDGVTPLGPPRAVRVTLTFQIATGKGDPIVKTAAQVIMVRAAPGTYTPPLQAPPTDGATDPSGGSSGGSGTGGSTGGSTGGAAGGSTGGAGASTGGKTGGSAGGSSMPSAPSSGGAGSSGGKAGGSTGGSSGGSMPSAPSSGGNTGGGNSGGGKAGGSSGGAKGGGK